MKWWQGFVLLPLSIALVLYTIVRALAIDPRWFVPDVHARQGMHAALMMLIFSAGLMHALFLLVATGLSTRASRRFSRVLFALLLFVFAWVILNGEVGSGWYPRSPYTWSYIFACIFALWMALGGIRSFSLPSTLLGLVPLFLFYAIPMGILFLYGQRRSSGYVAILSLLIIPLYLMAANFSPNHRRIAKEWRPTRLPRLPKSRGLGGSGASAPPRSGTPIASTGSSQGAI